MEDLAHLVETLFEESRDVQSRFVRDNREHIAAFAVTLAQGFRAGRKVLLFGNGGSAADAQHLAAEFVGRFSRDRSPLPALSLATDTSVLTAVGNDYGYTHVFARQLEAIGNRGDTAVAISTSGSSPNVLVAVDTARRCGLRTVGFTGQSGGELAGRVETLFRVPSPNTPRIQETHLLLGHVICELVDRLLFPDVYGKD